MTDIRWGRDGSVGPPWSVDLLADLQAGVVEPDVASELWPKVSDDPEAAAIIAALEATQVDLRGLADPPFEAMPAEFAARLDHAIAAEVAAGPPVAAPSAPPPVTGVTPRADGAPVLSLDAARRRRRNRFIGWGTGLVAAAAAAVAVVVATVPMNDNMSGVAEPPGAGPSGADGPASPPPLAFRASELGDQMDKVRGARDFGPFHDEGRRSECLAANGLDPRADPLGGRQVTVDGQQGVLLALLHGLGEVRLLVVDPQCGTGHPGKIAERIVGGSLAPTR